MPGMYNPRGNHGNVLFRFRKQLGSDRVALLSIYTTDIVIWYEPSRAIGGFQHSVKWFLIDISCINSNNKTKILNTHLRFP